MGKPEREGKKNWQGLKELPLVQREFHFYRVWKHKLATASHIPKLNQSLPVGMTKLAKWQPCSWHTHTHLWMDKGHLSATWGPKQHWKLLLKLHQGQFCFAYAPLAAWNVDSRQSSSWLAKHQSVTDLPQSEMGTVSSAAPALLSALEAPVLQHQVFPPSQVSPKVPAWSSRRAWQYQVISHCSLTLELSCWFIDGTTITVGRLKSQKPPPLSSLTFLALETFSKNFIFTESPNSYCAV